MENTKIVFIGTSNFGAIILKKLIKVYRLVLVVTTSFNSPVAKEAKTNKIPITFDLNEIKKVNPDLTITAAYGKIVPENVLNVPKYGSLNVHPSLLPEYRGPSPIQTTILNGDKKTGVTIILMDTKIDHGAIISNSEFLISKDYNYKELDKALALEGANLLLETIPKWTEGELKAKEQDHSKATSTRIIKKKDGQIDWQKSPQEIERKVRAFNSWPGTFIVWKNKIIKILEVRIENNKLVIEKVQPEGKKPMNFEDFLRGHKDFRI